MKDYKNATVTVSPLMAEVELKYKSKTKPSERTKVTESKNCYNYLKNIWDGDKIDYIEEVIVLMLNRANEIIGWAKVSTGGTSATVCDPKIIFQLALLHNASSIILSHNHPSGNLKPSQADIDITNKIINGGKILDINVLDHLIITENGYLSLNDEGLM